MVFVYAGEVLLENVELVLEAFDYLQLPFAIKKGSRYYHSFFVFFVGKMTFFKDAVIPLDPEERSSNSETQRRIALCLKF